MCRITTDDTYPVTAPAQIRTPDQRLRVFISSTLGELAQERRAARAAVELRDLLVDDLAVLLTERFEAFHAAPATERETSNLPTSISTFLGREAALEELQALLGDDRVRLVTLTGPGGTGKTRLAVEVARALVDRFEDGVFFVDLSAERDQNEVFAAIGRTLGMAGATEASPLDALKRVLHQRHALLLLDNFEQVTTAGPGVVELLQHSPREKALVTSREALRVSGERLFPVPPLELPEQSWAEPTVEAVVRSEAL